MGTDQAQNHKNKSVLIESYLLKEARSGDMVPMINGIHLHSCYDPFREADSFIEQQYHTLKSKKTILLLGLGLGYHLKKMVTTLEQLHNNQFTIRVIEPIEKLFDDAKKYNLLPQSENIIYHTNNSINRLYQNRDLLNFLADRSGIIIHPGSLALNRSFYEAFLAFRSDQLLSDARDYQLHPEIQSYFNIFNHDHELTLDELSEQIRQTKCDHQIDHLVLALQQFRKKHPTFDQAQGGDS